MKKRIVMACAAAITAMCAFGEKFAIDYSVKAQGTNEAVTAISGVAGNTNFVQITGMLVTVPASSVGTLKFYMTDTKGVSGVIGDPLKFGTFTTNSAVFYCVPDVINTDGRVFARYPQIVYGTNSSFSIKQNVASTNDWKVRIFYTP